jgi:hypothetical protein
MFRPRVSVHAVVCVAIFVAIVVMIAGIVVLSKLADRRALAAAHAALPGARAFLASDPAYADVGVRVDHTEDEGYGLWFSGSLPTQAECDQLEAELRKRYGSADFGFMFSVVSRNLNGP